MVRFLLENGVVTETQPPDSSYLTWAAHQRDPEIVKLLLAHRANLLTEEPPGIDVLPLVNAVTFENYPVARLLRGSIYLEEIMKLRG
ncbi:hypothetical protein N7517_007958 [Penicillium concentricum]|uniref:Uncharacterized protein n=1 Tax=Penicillium concentricum TaxID=293559 RepID=A0A9W9RRS3_9EURO|nr:uncharacterized protein N7517_007958 [Penicillium concentricum]KAJ5365072.1 hypothetical protein N7517_007958 [Penicillium concentricum]